MRFLYEENIVYECAFKSMQSAAHLRRTSCRVADCKRRYQIMNTRVSYYTVLTRVGVDADAPKHFISC
jgi:hypothetical protein